MKDLWLRLDGVAGPKAILVSYPIRDPQESAIAPHGWEMLHEAISSGSTVQIEYDGGTRGTSPRSITPLRFQQRGGETYVVAFCHLDSLKKSFRLDRIRTCILADTADPGKGHVDPGTMSR